MSTQSSQAETGAQLFSRLLSTQTKPSQLSKSIVINKRLDIFPGIFSEGLENKSIVEVSGKTSSGKTELFYSLIAQLLLPAKWKLTHSSSTYEVDLIIKDKQKQNYKCCEKDEVEKVLLIETDSKFSMLRLFTVLESILTSAHQSQIGSLNSAAQSLLGQFARERLKTLVVYRCSSSEELVLALAAAEYFVQNLTSSAPIPLFIDSVNANYEIFDRTHHKAGLADLSHAQNYMLTLVRRLVSRYDMVVFGTCTEWTPGGVGNASETAQAYWVQQNKSYEKWRSAVNYRIRLYGDQSERKISFEKLCDVGVKENVANDARVLAKDVDFKIINAGLKITL